MENQKLGFGLEFDSCYLEFCYILVGPERKCLRKGWELPFLEMRSNISETAYYNASPVLSSCLPGRRQGGQGRDEGKGRDI